MGEEYDIIEIPGKHGRIKLHIPKKEATREDIEEFHREIAEAIIIDSKGPAEK